MEQSDTATLDNLNLNIVFVSRPDIPALAKVQVYNVGINGVMILWIGDEIW